MSCVWLSFEGDMHPMLHPRGDELDVLATAKASSLHDVAPVQPALSPVGSGRSQWLVDAEGPCRNGRTPFMQDGISTALHPHDTAPCPSLCRAFFCRKLCVQILPNLHCFAEAEVGLCRLLGQRRGIVD